MNSPRASQAQSLGRLGAMRALGTRHHYPLVGVYAHRFAAPRFALIGDAAVGMHPVTAHGWNFGLYGVEVLARELKAARAAGRDIGALTALQAYERVHRLATLPIYLGTNAVSRCSPTSGRCRSWRAAPCWRSPSMCRHSAALIKSAVTRQLTGKASGFSLPPPPWRRPWPQSRADSR